MGVQVLIRPACSVDKLADGLKWTQKERQQPKVFFFTSKTENEE